MTLSNMDAMFSIIQKRCVVCERDENFVWDCRNGSDVQIHAAALVRAVLSLLMLENGSYLNAWSIFIDIF